MALRILGKEGEAKVRAELDRHRTQFKRALRGQFVGRSRYAEDRLADAVRRGTRQYVVLGAGLDTYACRHPGGDLRVFEVDHPATQGWKRARIAEAGLVQPACLAFAPADFETVGINDALAGAGFDASAPAFVACLGVSYYLAKEAFAATLRWAAGSAAGSELVLDFMPLRSAQAQDAFRKLAQIVAERGEPLKSFFDPAEMEALARTAGFSLAEAVAAEAIDAAYFKPLASDLRMRGYMLHATV
jgi:methyltransferase (TIGR00027 family)